MRLPGAAWGAVVVTIVGCGGRADTEPQNEAPADSLAAAMQAVGSMASMQPVTLSESDVEHFVAALEDLNRAGVRHESRLGADPSEATQLAEGLRGSAEALGILQKHGFDLPRFQVVSYTVALAIAAEDADGSAPNVDEAIAEVEKMKGQLPREQYEAMLAAAKSASGIVQDLQAQPAGNVALVKRFRERIERIGK